ncbi:UNVERIFIED_CONTAM: hypothetical protein GTU68_033685 [Idotea baltica]|nr:hypothetical protein [Idotea baltica]
MTSRTLDERVGARVFLKCENLQRMGAFKFRGAYNAICCLSDEQRARGVLAYSSGNHAQAVALAAKLLGTTATIVMPSNAPAVKLQATRDYGAQVIEFDQDVRTREDVAAEVLAGTELSLIKPFDNADVIAGQGTAAAELHEEVADLDWVIAPCGGGGLLSGTAIATKHLRPDCRVVGIEPELADDATRSFRTGTLQTVHNPPTIADGTRTHSMGELTFPLVCEHVDDMQTVSEEAIMDAVRFLFYRTKLVVEPSGALGVAALLTGAVHATGRVGVILSGGNVDAQTFAQILAN